MRNKYNDNKLAEELDLIVLLNDNHLSRGIPHGALGTLIYAYTGSQNPLYAEFALADGTKKEEPLSLPEFRVLNERNEKDLSLIVAYLKKSQGKTKEKSSFVSNLKNEISNV